MYEKNTHTNVQYKRIQNIKTCMEPWINEWMDGWKHAYKCMKKKAYECLTKTRMQMYEKESHTNTHTNV